MSGLLLRLPSILSQVLLSCSEPLTTDEMPYMDGEKETDAVELSERKPGQCEQFTPTNHPGDELSPHQSFV